MNRFNLTSHTVRFACAAAAVVITGALFQGVASLSRPTAIEQVALAKKSTVTVADAAVPSPSLQVAGAR